LFRSKILLPSALGSIAARLSQNGLLETKPVTRYAALLVLVSEPQILKFSPRCFAPKFRQNFTRRAAESNLLSKALASSRKTRAINFTPLFTA